MSKMLYVSVTIYRPNGSAVCRYTGDAMERFTWNAGPSGPILEGPESMRGLAGFDFIPGVVDLARGGKGVYVPDEKYQRVMDSLMGRPLGPISSKLAQVAALERAAFLLRKEGNGPYDIEQACIVEELIKGMK